MAQDGAKYLEQLLRQASREVDQAKLDQIVAEIYRIVAQREQGRKNLSGRKRAIRRTD